MTIRSVVDSPESLGKLVHRLRTDRGMTQRQLADAVGITQRYLYELEAGMPKRIDSRYFSILSLMGIRLTAEVADDDD